MGPRGKVPLAKAVEGIRSELEEAMIAASDKDLKFEVETVEMCFAVEAHTDQEADGRVRFWVVEAGAAISGGESTTQTITVRLKPRMADGGSPLIADFEQR
jgi:hypothetical protein